MTSETVTSLVKALATGKIHYMAEGLPSPTPGRVYLILDKFISLKISMSWPLGVPSIGAIVRGVGCYCSVITINTGRLGIALYWYFMSGPPTKVGGTLLPC